MNLNSEINSDNQIFSDFKKTWDDTKLKWYDHNSSQFEKDYIDSICIEHGNFQRGLEILSESMEKVERNLP